MYRNSATLIDNILVKNVKGTMSSGNVVSDVSDHFTQLCIFHSCKNKMSPPRPKIRDYSRFSKSIFHDKLSQIEWDSIITDNQNDIDRTFSNFFNTLNKLVNKHAPLKPVSKGQAHCFIKPWITKGLRKSIKIKNAFFYSIREILTNINIIETDFLLFPDYAKNFTTVHIISVIT